jgi:hypothetical protein
MADEDDALKPKLHIGKKYIVTYVGGDWHGEKKQVRAPIRESVEVARPPRYLGENYYDAMPSGIGYDTYILLYHADEPYYVINDLVDDFKKNSQEVLERHIETTNQRLIRVEKEKQEEEEHELECQKKLAEKDFKELGIAIEYKGKRIDPRDVRIFINSEHEGAKKRFIQREKL